MITVTVRNTLAENTAKYLVGMNQRAEAAMREVGEHIKQKSLEVCPEDSGALKASCKVVLVGRGYDAKVSVSYDTPYAAQVHEDMTVSHPIHHGGRDCGGGAKYLETPFREAEPVAQAIFAKRLWQ